MTRSDGIRIEPGLLLDRIKGEWSVYECTYRLPGSDAELSGTIQGDGEMFELDTLTDEDGDVVELL